MIQTKETLNIQNCNAHGGSNDAVAGKLQGSAAVAAPCYIGIKVEVSPPPTTPTRIKLWKFGTGLYKDLEKSFSKNVNAEIVSTTTKFISHKRKYDSPMISITHRNNSRHI